MTRKELVAYFHNKVIMENNPYTDPELEGEELNDDYFEFYPNGPFDNTVEDPWDFSQIEQVEVDRKYKVGFNRKLLASENPPEKLIWGISESWQFSVVIPLTATRVDQCTSIGDSGE